MKAFHPSGVNVRIGPRPWALVSLTPMQVLEHAREPPYLLGRLQEQFSGQRFDVAKGRITIRERQYVEAAVHGQVGAGRERQDLHADVGQRRDLDDALQLFAANGGVADLQHQRLLGDDQLQSEWRLVHRQHLLALEARLDALSDLLLIGLPTDPDHLFGVGRVWTSP
jgi:hypothetical protein